MTKKLQMISRTIFLALFIVLIVLNKVQIWMAIFGISLILSLFFGRFYCGFICPINSGTRFITFIKKKLKIKSFKIPAFLKKPIVRYIALAIFVGLFIFVMVSKKPLPVLPAIAVLAIILTLFFPENLWHRYLCPYGTLLKIPSSKSLYKLKYTKDSCLSCNACVKICPSDAITKEENKYYIKNNECLLCLDCKEKCPDKAIEYTKK